MMLLCGKKTCSCYLGDIYLFKVNNNLRETAMYVVLVSLLLALSKYVPSGSPIILVKIIFEFRDYR